MVQRCSRCKGPLYSDDPTNPKSDIWCFHCGEWIKPANWKPFPYVSRLEDIKYASNWDVDQNGNIVDDIDRKVEEFLADGNICTVSQVARALHCSNGDARISLDRLVRNQQATITRYGPQDRWAGYRRA